MNRRKVARIKTSAPLKHIQDNEQCAEQNKGLKWKGLKVKKQSPQVKVCQLWRRLQWQKYALSSPPHPQKVYTIDVTRVPIDKSEDQIFQLCNTPRLTNMDHGPFWRCVCVFPTVTAHHVELTVYFQAINESQEDDVGIKLHLHPFSRKNKQHSLAYLWICIYKHAEIHLKY